HLRLRQAGQADPALAREPAETALHRRRIRQVDAAAPFGALLEDQRLLDLQAAIAAEGAGHGIPFDHFSTSPSAVSSASMSSALTVSVAATSRRSASSGRPGMSRDTGTPPRMPLAASFST